MAVPKRKTPRSEDAPAPRVQLASVRACALGVPELRRVKQPHVVCRNCGWYGGRQVDRRRVSDPARTGSG